ncbi:MAG: glycerol-3-phosphate dehydrogenase/oxidase [Proteobacteria bacterium]|nr:glycerol-3-phosphate dehydrogenase/oxidase [Pseudomonadota bacterium]
MTGGRVTSDGPRRLSELPKTTWDVIVVGGGITGAGVFELAGRRGLSCLLLEQGDFASGTSSKSGKLVHGGIRYLKQGQFQTTWHSVRERERLLKRFPGLVAPLTFLYPIRRGSPTGRLLAKIGLSLYDLMAGRRDHRHLSLEGLLALAPSLSQSATHDGYSFHDALTDDARLVLRVIEAGRVGGNAALNYVAARDLLRTIQGEVRGVAAEDILTGASAEIEARVVINAAGAWTDDLRARLGLSRRLRRLRGSHLVFSGKKFPLRAAVGLAGPVDSRSMYVLPWEGVTLMGTTDLDHQGSLDQEPSITPVEGDYLLTTIRHWFEDLDLTEADVMSTFAGVRPVVDTGKADPSKESREHVVWADQGLVTVTGGKLTTFGLLARDALAAAGPWLDGGDGARPPEEEASDVPPAPALDPSVWTRLAARYGRRAPALVEAAPSRDLEAVPGTDVLWAELSWAAGREDVRHLDDLLLRRVRLGLLLPEGGADLLDRVQAAAGPVLGWDEDRWRQERERYGRLWRCHYSPELIRP